MINKANSEKIFENMKESSNEVVEYDDEMEDDEPQIQENIQIDGPAKRKTVDLASMIGSLVPSSTEFSWTTEHVFILDFKWLELSK